MTDNTPEAQEPAPVTLNDDDAPGPDPKDYVCTCLSRDPEDHLWDCWLWECWEFEHGWMLWDAEQERLVEVDDDEIMDAWEMTDDGDVIATSTTTTTPATSTQGSFATTTYVKCRHYQEGLQLPDGTVVYASSHHYDRKGDPIPDLGIYLDGMWTPDTVAFLVGCPDYGIPVPSMQSVLHMAREGLRVAKEGGRVEIGCIGGHGRTGLMLAIMVVLTMDEPDGEAAVKFVRDNYCDRAVESARQEWYVKCVAAEITGQPYPPEPPKPKPVTYTTAFADGFQSQRQVDGKWTWGTYRKGIWTPDAISSPASSGTGTVVVKDPYTVTWSCGPIDPDPVGKTDGVISDGS